MEKDRYLHYTQIVQTECRLTQRYINLPTIWESLQNCKRQEGNMNPVPRWGPTNVRDHDKYNSPGRSGTLIGPPLIYHIREETESHFVFTKHMQMASITLRFIVNYSVRRGGILITLCKFWKPAWLFCNVMGQLLISYTEALFYVIVALPEVGVGENIILP